MKKGPGFFGPAPLAALLSFASSSLSFFSQEGCNIDTVGVSSESHIDIGLNGFFRDYLSTAGTDDSLISHTFFNTEVVYALHVLVVNIVVGNDGGSQDRCV